MRLRLLIIALLLALPAQSWAARLLTAGFEENDLTATTFIAGIGTAPTINITSPHSGTYRMSTAATATSTVRYVLPSDVTSGTYYLRTYWRTGTAAPASDTTVFYNINSAATAGGLEVLLRTGSVLRLRNPTTTTTVDSTATIVADTWYRIEAEHVLSDTVGSITMRLYSDSNVLLDTISITGQDTMTTNIRSWHFGKAGANAPVYSYDDIAINDTTGSFQTSWPGIGKIAMLVPNADTSITWENEAAGAATFTKIDDLPGTPDDVTTYNTEIVTLNSTDRFGLTALGAEVPSGATLKLIQVAIRGGSTQTATTGLRLSLWDEAGTKTDAATDYNLNVNGWVGPSNTGFTPGYVIYDAAAKTKANVDSFDAGYTNVTDLAVLERRVTALWVNVEWTEPVASAGSGASPSIIWMLEELGQ